jgi:hypothetical protein
MLRKMTGQRRRGAACCALRGPDPLPQRRRTRPGFAKSVSHLVLAHPTTNWVKDGLPTQAASTAQVERNINDGPALAQPVSPIQ